MKKTLYTVAISLTLCFMVLCGVALAERQVYADQGGVCVFVKNGKAGLLDAEDRVLLDAEYDNIEPFGSDDYAVVRLDGLKGVVLRNGTVSIPCRATYFKRLENTGLAEVEYEGDGSSHLVEMKTGRVLHEGNRYSYSLKDGLIYAMKYGFLDVICTEILDFDGHELFSADGSVYEFSEDLAVVVDTERVARLVDLQGNVLLEGMRNDLHISEGKAFYNWVEETPEGELWHCGIWRKDGAQTELITDSYTRFESYSAPYCVHTGDGDRIGYVNDDCQWVIPPIYSDGYPFVDGAAVVCEEGKYRLIDEQGNQVGDTQWTWDNLNALFAAFFDNSPLEMPVLPVDVGDVTRLINRRGELVNEEAFQTEFNELSSLNRWLVLEDLEGRFCLVDGTDGEVLLRVDADSWRAFPSGDAYALWLRTDGLWGWMDYLSENAGQWIVDPCAVEVDHTLSGNGAWALLPDENTVYFNGTGKIVGPGHEYYIEGDW